MQSLPGGGTGRGGAGASADSSLHGFVVKREYGGFPGVRATRFLECARLRALEARPITRLQETITALELDQRETLMAVGNSNGRIS